MKKRNLKVFTALLAIALVAGVTLFYACKKEEVIKNDIIANKWQEKIEYMEIPCVDFSRIKKEGSLSKGGDMLQFESWEHYAEVIDAMLEFSYDYIATRVQQIRDSIPGIDDDDLSLILHNESIYQFMPLYSFCQQLQFNNNAFTMLRAEEIQWQQNPNALRINNPFEEMALGYVQSAVHNTSGNVVIGGEVFNPSTLDDEGGGNTYSCHLKKDRNNCVNEWPTYNYGSNNSNVKKREFRAFIKSYPSYSYGKTSVYYFDKRENRIVWCCWIDVDVDGKRFVHCDPSNIDFIYFHKHGSVFASVVEKYCWYSAPNYLHPYQTAIVFSAHSAPGSSALAYNQTHLGL